MSHNYHRSKHYRSIVIIIVALFLAMVIGRIFISYELVNLEFLQLSK